MRCLLADHQHEGLPACFLLLRHPLQRHVGHDRGVVARHHPSAAPIKVELGVEVFALALVRHEIVEAGPGLVALFPHVPLADVGGLVAGLLQPAREAVEIGRVVGEVVGHAVGVGVEAAEDRGPARRAEARCAEHVFKVDAFLGEPVDVGRFQVRMAAAGEGIPANVVAEHHDDVWAIGSVRGTGCGARRNQSAREQHQHRQTVSGQETAHGDGLGGRGRRERVGRGSETQQSRCCEHTRSTRVVPVVSVASTTRW